MPRAPAARDSYTVAAAASARVGSADLLPFPELREHELVSPALASDAAGGEFGEADERAPASTPPVAERLVAPPTRIRVGAPAPVVADAPARNGRAYPIELATTGLDAAPEAAASTYIHIGRVELHAMPPPPLPRARTRPAHQPMPLEEYLRRRNGTPR